MAGISQPLQIFGDFGLAGGEDTAPNPLQEFQICINFYSEVNKQNPKEILGLLGCPGLVQLVAAPGGGAPAFTATTTAWAPQSTVTNLPVRCLFPLPGGTTALAVIGATLYLVSQKTAATRTGFPTLALTVIGTLSTNTGVVVMAANNGLGVPLFTGTAPGTVAIVDGPYGYYYNTVTGTFAQITDPGFVGADRVVSIDGFFIFNNPGTQSFYITTGTAQTQTLGISFVNGYYALKDGASDNIVTIFENKEMLWLIGERTTEVWYNTGGQYQPFARLVGTLMQSGCKAKHSVARFNSSGQDGVIWFGRNERGDNLILRSRGFNIDVVSSPAFSAEVAQYPTTSDAIGYTYQEDTHEFFVLTFPSADTTWVYDEQSGLMHKRLSYDPYQSSASNTFLPPGFHRHRSNAFMNFLGMRIVGDYQCGSLYQLTRKAYTDAGWPLLAKRRTPHIWDKGQRGRTFMASLQLDFVTGQGNPSGLGVNPVATITISRDGGRTFGQKWPAPMGAIGQNRVRTMWRRLGFARDCVIDLEVIDPVPRDLIGATLRAFSSGYAGQDMHPY